MKKFLTAALLAFILIQTAVGMASAASPYATYTYSIKGEVLESPDAYVPDIIVDADYMYHGGNLSIGDMRDLETDAYGNVYIVDGVSGLIVLDSHYKYLFSVSTFVNDNGIPDTFMNPSGVFANEKYIYVCDTDNNRIVMFDRAQSFLRKEGVFVKTVAQPVSELFTAGAIYKPVALVCDEYGRLFIVSSTTYQGIIVMGDTGDFYGFIGAQKTTATGLGKFWELFRSEEQKALDEENVSTEYNNITIDKDNFIYITTSTIDPELQQNALSSGSKSGDYAPVKKLNASGMDVMRRNGFYPPSGEVKVSTETTAEIQGASTIMDAAVGPNETWSIIDQKRSKTFTYDRSGNLLFAFGDMGQQTGNITKLTAVTYHNDNMLLLDSANCFITVYRRTEYGDILMTALEHSNNREYDKAVEDWENILKRNNNFDLAYVGIGKALLLDGSFEEAMGYFKAAYDTGNYVEAYREVRKEWMTKFFWIIPVVIVVVLLVVAKLVSMAAKFNKKTALKVGHKNLREEVIYAFHVILHPFDGFWDLKHEKRGSARSAFLILLTTVVAFFYQSIGSGYIYSSTKTYGTIISIAISVLVPLFLWVIANWCLTTLFEGEGSFKDIFIASCYALTPLPLFVIPCTLISGFLTADEAEIITAVLAVAYIWVGLLLFFGMMITHDYSMIKNILTTIFTIVGMAFIMFMALLFSTLMMKIISFVTSIVEELQYRT